MSYQKDYNTTGFNMDDEFGSHIDENGFISFTKQKPKKLSKEDQIYGIWNQEVEESVFKGSKQLAKTTLAMNFRKSGLYEHNSETGIKVKYANQQQSSTVQKEDQQSKKSNDIKQNTDNQKKVSKQKKSVKFDELQQQQRFEDGFDPLLYDVEIQEEDEEEEEKSDNEEDKFSHQNLYHQKNKQNYKQMFQRGGRISKNDEDDENDFREREEYEEEDEDNDDDDVEGFQRKNKNKLFFKSTSSKKQEKNKLKSILKQKNSNQQQGNDFDNDLQDLDELGDGSGEENNDQEIDDEDAYEDQDEKFQFKKASKSSQIHLTKEQMRKKKIFNFKRNKEDDEDAIFEEQTQQFNLPLRFGQQRKQFKKKTDQEIEEESKAIVNLETQQEMIEAKMHKENYGKGFDMLQKMGFKLGKGIGKEEQGRAKPVEAQFKQSFTMQDNYKQMEAENKKLLKEYGIDVEAEIDEFETAYSEFKKNQSEFGDYDDENTIEFEKTYVKRNDENKRFPNRFFAHLNKKSKQAKQGSMTDIGDSNIKSDNSLPGSSNFSGVQSMKIIDMRGDSSVTYDGAKGDAYTNFFAASKILDSKSLAKQENPIFSEMLYNLKNKLDKSKGKKMNLSSKIKTESDRIVTVQYEEQQLTEKQNSHKKVMNQTVTLLNNLQQMRQDENNLNGDDVYKHFKEMFENCGEQFIHYNLEQLLVKQITQSLKIQFQNSIYKQNLKSQSNNIETEVEEEEQEISLQKTTEDFGYDIEGSSIKNKSILQQSQDFQIMQFDQTEIKKSVQLIQQVEKLLTKIFLFKQNSNLHRYESELSGNIYLQRDTNLNEKNERIIQRYIQFIINHSFMPHLKNFMIKQFNPTNLRSNNQIIDCLEEYQKVLPKAVISDLVQSFILPKLNDAVKKWHPSTKAEGKNTQADVDLWLIPWITIISPIDLLKDTFKLVLAKYSQVLSKWEIQDKSMFEKLKPWKQIISESQWNDLMLKQIIPKLQFYLDQLEINPSEQKDLDVIENIVLWCDLIQPKDVTSIMEDTLLVKLAEVLMEWLSSEGAEKQEIKSWLQSWESLLGDKIMEIEIFQDTFNQFFLKLDELN
ncbi:G-patch domain protein (macronuclear) [Tetrahymena thermophila SB210]|uniref:G-patch domain protein n=2 Tax=Tetrahymena thermophila TaxID=5911 RepID=I7MMG4_TETTS|nr:G-patch domain protein [Tetrahymena thermophila SB210]EAS04805.2 G-patch domain protein [Tetrahymena thermophila SB210]|eukprot:XP_001025050.2 G-patch domain protein [Tetrahymena thermophila SB210]